MEEEKKLLDLGDLIEMCKQPDSKMSLKFTVLDFSKKSIVEKKDNGNVRVNLKPMSVNKCYTGRRFKTKASREFSKKVAMCLPPIEIPKPPYKIYLKFGFSSAASDWDNCIKSTQDLIAEKYKFNDKLIRKGVVETEIVKKGMEYFEFKLESL